MLHWPLCTISNCRLIQTTVTVRKRSIRVKIGDLLSRVTLKFDEWPWKTTGHFFYVASSFKHHFIIINEFKLKLQSGNAHFGSKSEFFIPCDLEIWRTTVKNNRAPATSSFVYHFVAIGEFKLELPSGNTQFGSKSTIFRAVWPWNLTDDPEKAKVGYDLCDLDLWPLTLTFCMDIASVIGNNSWKFRDDTMIET